MKILHGIDLTNFKRPEFNNNELAHKILHKNELEVYNGLKNDLKPRYLAKHWAIKEALYKAYNHHYPMNEVLIIKENEHLFTVIDNITFTISVSYEEPYVMASVIAIE